MKYNLRKSIQKYSDLLHRIDHNRKLLETFEAKGDHERAQSCKETIDRLEKKRATLADFLIATRDPRLDD